MHGKLKLYLFIVNDEDTVLLEKSIEINKGIRARDKRKIGLEKFIKEAEKLENNIRLKRLSTIKI